VGLANRSSQAPRPHPAFITDLWYTLVYYRPSDQVRVEARRRAAWIRACERANIPSDRAHSLLQHLDEVSRRDEARGRTPPLEVRARQLGRWAGAKLDARALVDELDRCVEDRPPRVAPHARPVLRRLRREGFRVGIVSNIVLESAAGVRRLLDRMALSPLVDAVALSADDGIAKPDPRPFRRCLRLLGVPPSRAWYLGDQPSDVAGALAAGIAPIRYLGLARSGPGRGLPDPPGSSPALTRRWAEVPAFLRARLRSTRSPPSRSRAGHRV
jgi:FMN phosphatase YigB (HAD superfamily)